tara:strand:- start:2925 stop:3674 length:750 start_codon:yes stop_codon:yes gene_type:complete
MTKFKKNRLPITLKNTNSLTGLLGGRLRGILDNKIGGLQTPLVRGADTTRYTKPILQPQGDDIVIKYKNRNVTTPQLQGESHRIVLIGYTEGTTEGYAYPEGDSGAPKLKPPANCNVIMKVKGTATVVGGHNATYPIGHTEAFAYYTGFVVKADHGGVVQLGTAGGEVEFQLREGAVLTSCTLSLTVTDGEFKFGLKDSQTDTKRVWALSVDMDINLIKNIMSGYGENWALFQDGLYINFEGQNRLLWN